MTSQRPMIALTSYLESALFVQSFVAATVSYACAN